MQGMEWKGDSIQMKTAEKFDLSEKIAELAPSELQVIKKEDVKEFIRLLKEGIIMSIERKEGKYEWISIINKLTGKSLI